MLLDNLDELLTQFITDIDSRPFDVDPKGEEDWHSLTVGWAIGKGLEPETAREFAYHVRYNTDAG